MHQIEQEDYFMVVIHTNKCNTQFVTIASTGDATDFGDLTTEEIIIMVYN